MKTQPNREREKQARDGCSLKDIPPISQTLSASSEQVSPLQIPQTASAKSTARVQSPQFPLSWSHYVRLIPIADVELHLTTGQPLWGPIWLKPALVANSLFPGKGKRTMCEPGIQIGNSG
jgi:hypothetical protein